MADYTTDNTVTTDTEPATAHDVTEGGIIGAVGGAIVGALAGGPIGAIIGAVVGGAASAGAVDVVDKHDHDYARTATVDQTTDAYDDDVVANDLTATPAYDDTVSTSTTTAYDTSVPTVATTATTGYDTAYTTGTASGTDEIVVPVVAEELSVGKREVQSGGARVHTEVIERPVEEQISLHDETVTVDRRPVDRAVTDADLANLQDRTIELTETHEIPVVAKTARVVEEVVIGKTATDRTETIHDTVRETTVEVEKVAGETTRTSYNS